MANDFLTLRPPHPTQSTHDPPYTLVSGGNDQPRPSQPYQPNLHTSGSVFSHHVVSQLSTARGCSHNHLLRNGRVRFGLYTSWPTNKYSYPTNEDSYTGTVDGDGGSFCAGGSSVNAADPNSSVVAVDVNQNGPDNEHFVIEADMRFHFLIDHKMFLSGSFWLPPTATTLELGYAAFTSDPPAQNEPLTSPSRMTNDAIVRVLICKLRVCNAVKLPTSTKSPHPCSSDISKHLSGT
ncbi:hypothetical protein PIB30_055709 [Stylosanthes scabra]|uniref:Uncharacterized protein n=1 Tax=Stylosanthes scabra TaxID=79078 RepID=A0ABU6XHE3_9FABA|nr:hypothetical protein [Stylosanthes scabra]